MKLYIKMVVLLTAIGMISGALLVTVFRFASPLIEENKTKELQSSIFEIFPETKEYNELVSEGDFKLYEVFSDAGALIGYIFTAKGSGYQSDIVIIAGISSDLVTLKGIKILESAETPGLGAKIAEPEFTEQFRALKVIPQIEYVKNRAPQKPNEIQAITGATISSKSLVKLLSEGIEKTKEKVKLSANRR